VPALVNRDAFEAAETPAGKADVLRYELLLQFGGVYVDADFEPRKPVGDLFDGINAFFADEGPNTPTIGILGSVAGDQFFRHVVAGVPASVREHSALVEKTGPRFFARAIKSFFGPGRAIRNLGWVWEHVSRDCSKRLYGFESRYFYPYGYWERHRRDEPFPDAYAVHHWAHSWA
jgi:mannosyltransferase OCH1-like enzyme